MPLPQVLSRSPRLPASNYGAASKHEFDNPAKWVTEGNIPLLKEHELTDEDGNSIGYIDREALEEIAANNNRRVVQTGDPATAILGHTSDNPADPEKPAKGFVVNYAVKPFGRDLKTGKILYAIHGDLKVRPRHKGILEDYPRRSVELWLSKKEIDPVALLGGTTPEQDLGVVIRYSRLNRIALLGGTTPKQDLGTTIHYSRAGGTVLRYSMNSDTDAEDDDMPPIPPRRMSMNGVQNTPKGKKVSMGQPGPKKVKYSEDEFSGENEDFDGEGDGGEMNSPHDEGGSDAAAEDPMIAKLLQSKAFQDMLKSTMMETLQQLMAEEEGGAPGGDQTGGSPPMPGSGGMGDALGGDAPNGADGLAPQPDQEAMRDHAPPPVRFGADTGFAGPQNGFIPTTGTTGKRYDRNNQPARSNNVTRTQPRQSDPEVVRLSRQNKILNSQVQELRLHYARNEAESTIREFEAEGVIFDDREFDVEILAQGTDETREIHKNVIKKNYQRAQGDIANPAFQKLSRFARSEQGSSEGGAADDDGYEPKTPQEANMLAEAQNRQKKPYAEIVKMARKKGLIR